MLQDRYRLEAVIGRGAMGEVYRGTQIALGRPVAIKFLHPRYAENRRAMARFQREARAAASIGSEHVVNVLDLGTLEDETQFIVMEMLEGRELERVVANGPLPIMRALRILDQLCEAMAMAHANGIVHRDLKPANLFLVRRADGQDFVKVLDFGISKFYEPDAEHDPTQVTRAGEMLGTPRYMSPEQFAGSLDVDHRADIYSLGAIFHHCLAGSPPFDAPDLRILAMKVCAAPPPDLRAIREEVHPELARLAQEMMAKDPAERPTDCPTVRARLAPFLRGEAPREIPATRDGRRDAKTVSLGLAERLRGRPIVRTAALLGLLLSVVAIVAGVGMVFTRSPHAAVSLASPTTSAHAVVAAPPPAVVVVPVTPSSPTAAITEQRGNAGVMPRALSAPPRRSSGHPARVQAVPTRTEVQSPTPVREPASPAAHTVAPSAPPAPAAGGLGNTVHMDPFAR